MKTLESLTEWDWNKQGVRKFFKLNKWSGWNIQGWLEN